MKAHSIRSCLTPNYEPFYLIGYNSPLRELPAKGVHDDIFSQSTLLEIDDKWIFLFSTDWLEVEREFYQDLSERLHHKYGINKDLVLVSATHNHQSVRDHMKYARSGKFNPEYYEKVVQIAMDTFQQCLEQLEEVEAYWGKKVISGYYGSRIVSGALADNEVILVEFRNQKQEVVAAICNWAVHSTVLTPENDYLTKEFAGNVCHYFEKIKGYYPAMIVGAAGDCSTRATRQGNDFNELERVATGMAEEISKIEVTEKLTVNFQKITKTQHHCEVEIDQDEVQRIIDANNEELKTCEDFERRKILNSMMSGLYRKLKMDKVVVDWFAEVIHLKDLVIVVTPCELASKFGLEIKEQCKVPCCLIFGYTNGKAGYLFPKEYYGLTFETISSGIPSEEVESYINKIKSIL